MVIFFENKKPVETLEEMERKIQRERAITLLNLCTENAKSISLLENYNMRRAIDIILPVLFLDIINVALFAYRIEPLKTLIEWRAVIKTTGNPKLIKSLESLALFIEFPLNSAINTTVFGSVQNCLDELKRIVAKNFPPSSLDIYKVKKKKLFIVLVVVSFSVLLGVFKLYNDNQRARVHWENGEVELACKDKDSYCEDAKKVQLLQEKCEKEIEYLNFEKAVKYSLEAKKINLRSMASLDDRINTSLWAVNQALLKYHDKYGNYPLGFGPEVNFLNNGQFNSDWIHGLAPEFIHKLPRDPRNSLNKGHQYIYWSDGKDYKLIRHGVDDCEILKRYKPELIDPARDCFAYGYWTPKAITW